MITAKPAGASLFAWACVCSALEKGQSCDAPAPDEAPLMAGVFASMAVRSCQGALVDLEHIRSTCRSVFTDAVNGRLPGGDPFFGGGSVKTPGGERECRDLRRLNRLLEARRAASMEDIIRGVEEAAKAGARWRGSGVGETAGASRQLLASHAATSAAFEALEDCDEDAWIAVLPSQMEKDFLKSINHVYLALVGALQAYASDIAEYRTQ